MLVIPARFTAVSLSVLVRQTGPLWLFWLAPTLAALMGAPLHGWLAREAPDILGNP
ncbi:MAG: hypothetical protein ABIO17_02660 [Pseudoxanthomonas sp.]